MKSLVLSHISPSLNAMFGSVLKIGSIQKETYQCPTSDSEKSDSSGVEELAYMDTTYRYKRFFANTHTIKAPWIEQIPLDFTDPLKCRAA